MKNAILLIFIFLVARPALPGEEDVVEYLDVISVQSGHMDSWSSVNFGINISRYYVIDWPEEFHQVLPGIGIRGILGREPKLETLAKASYMGLVGGSLGPYFGKRGFGAGASAWAGIEFIGCEATYYLDEDGYSPEFGFYLSWRFGEMRNGKYRFGF